MTLYESEEAAKQAVERVALPPGDVLTIESMDIAEVVGQA